MLRVNSVQIEGIGPIKNLHLAFNDHFNIVCGQNGIGKTTILDCISQSFSGASTSLKRTAGLERGVLSVNISFGKTTSQKSVIIDKFRPDDNNRNVNGFYEVSNEVIVFRTHRNIPYKKLTSLGTDVVKNIYAFASDTIAGTATDTIKNWFINRYLFSAQPNTLEENQFRNFELAKECFTILNSNISFSRIIPNSFDVLLNTSLGEIYFEYLSSGYKSCLAVLLGLIEQVELRYKDPTIYIKDFSGIVIIDELDLHLHPDWQAKIYKALKIILPNAQIFTSTHSPHIIQIAEPQEIIALVYDGENNIEVNSLLNEKYGYQGWTVEEVLHDVMGMAETRTDSYLEAIDGFNKAIESENCEEAQHFFEILDAMLHPANSLRKVLKIQLIGIAAND